MADVSVRTLPLVLATAAVLTGCAVVNPNAPATFAPPSTTQVSTTASTPTPTPITPAGPRPTASGTTTGGAATAAPTTGQSADAEAAAALRPDFVAYYAAADQVLQAGGVGAPTQAMLDSMTGAALATWTTKASDFKAKGYKQTGATQVESFSPGSLDRAQGTASVDFCANSAGVKVSDAAGAVVPPADPAKLALGGTANLVYHGGHWRVVSLAGLTPIASCP